MAEPAGFLAATPGGAMGAAVATPSARMEEVAVEIVCAGVATVGVGDAGAVYRRRRRRRRGAGSLYLQTHGINHARIVVAAGIVLGPSAREYSPTPKLIHMHRAPLGRHHITGGLTRTWARAV